MTHHKFDRANLRYVVEYQYFSSVRHYYVYSFGKSLHVKGHWRNYRSAGTDITYGSKRRTRR